MSDTEKTVDLAQNLWKQLKGEPIAGKRLPQICGDIPMSIDRNGVWYYQGGPIGRKELVNLFASVLQRDEEGGHWLVTPAEMARIEVEDVAFIAVEMQCEAEGNPKDQAIRFRTNIDQWIPLDANHPLRVLHHPETGEPSPYIMCERGLEARLNRAVFYDLVNKAVEQTTKDGQTEMGIYSQGRFFSIGVLERE